MEALFVLWKTMGDAKWRERGWEIFQALERHARVQNGYASVHDVNQLPAMPNDDMPRCARSLAISHNLLAHCTIPLHPSYFLAET